MTRFWAPKAGEPLLRITDLITFIPLGEAVLLSLLSSQSSASGSDSPLSGVLGAGCLPHSLITCLAPKSLPLTCLSSAYDTGLGRSQLFTLPGKSLSSQSGGVHKHMRTVTSAWAVNPQKPEGGRGDRCTSMVDSGRELHLDPGGRGFEPGLQRLGGSPRPVVRGRKYHTDQGPPLYVKNHMTDAKATGRAMFSAGSRDLKSPISLSLLQMTHFSHIHLKTIPDMV